MRQANVMATYPIDDAIELLTKNLATAKTNFELVSKDLDRLKDQITTTEGTSIP